MRKVAFLILLPVVLGMVHVQSGFFEGSAFAATKQAVPAQPTGGSISSPKLVSKAVSPPVSSPAPAKDAAPVVKRSQHDSMFKIYEENREQGIGNYITADFVLTAYGLFLNDVLTAVEEEVLYPALRDFIAGTLEKLAAADQTAQGWRTAVGYVSVLRKLIDPGSSTPNEVADVIAAEMRLIDEHKGIETSHVTGVKEDFSQYLPRGKYTASENLQRYFRTMMYAGRMGFLLKESRATGVTTAMADDQTAAAVLLSKTVAEDEQLRGLYGAINDFLDFFVGRSDDLSVGDYTTESAGQPIAEVRKNIHAKAKQSGKMPQIISLPVDAGGLEPGLTVAEVAAGFRLLGLRYTLESSAFQNLTFDRVTDYTGDARTTPFTLAEINGRKVRGFPTVLDLMAGLGSARAKKMLTDRGDSSYREYKKRLGEFSGAVNALFKTSGKHGSLSEMNLATISTMLKKDSNESLNTALSFWIQNRHTIILYAKQSYTVVAKSIAPRVPERAKASLEPADGLYGSLAANLNKIGETFTENKGILQTHSESSASEKVLQFAEAMNRLKGLSQKAAKRKLEQADCDYLNNLDRLFAGLLAGRDLPIAVDIHTEPNSRMVVEEAIGYPLAVFDGEFRGTRYNCYEFKQPMDQRLTDEAWLKMLKEGKGSVKGSLSEQLFKIAL